MTEKEYEFQSAACDYGVYYYNNTGERCPDWNLPENETVLRAIVVTVAQKDDVDVYITNLPCSNVNDSNTENVYKLNTLDMVEEIDPTGATLPTPTLNFSYTNEKLLKRGTYEIEDYLNKFKGSKINVYCGLVSCDLSDLRNEYGEYKHALSETNYFKSLSVDKKLTSNYSHFGAFIIKNLKFNYDSYEIIVETEHLLFELMDNILTFDKDSCLMPQCLSFDRVYHQDLVDGGAYLVGNERYKFLTSFTLGENILDVDKNPADENHIPPHSKDPRCNYTYNRTVNDLTFEEKLTDHLDINQIYNVLSNTTKFENITGPFFLEEESRLAQPYSEYTDFDTKPIKFKGFDNYYSLYPLYSYLKNEKFSETLKEYMILNDLFLLPVNLNYTEKNINEKSNNKNEDYYYSNQCGWRLVGGARPVEVPFPEQMRYQGTQNGLGTYFIPSRSKIKYKISQHCILEKTNEKEKIEEKKVKLIKTIDIPITQGFLSKTDKDGNVTYEPSNGTEVKTFNFNYPDEINYEDNILGMVPGQEAPVMYRVPGKYDGNSIFHHKIYPYFGYTTPEEGVWFDESGDFLHIYGKKLDLLGSFDQDKPENSSLTTSDGFNDSVIINDSGSASDDLFGRRYRIRLIDGRKIITPKAFYHAKIQGKVFPYRPKKIDIRIVKPDVSYVDRKGNINTNKLENEHSLELSHISTKRHIPECYDRILKRVNEENLHPLYKINWTMMDDPFLRVGTLVYYPLRGKYVKVFITKETRSYKNNYRLQCEGLVVEETNTSVESNYSISKAMVTHKMKSDDTEERKETYYFEWEANESWDLEPSCYRFGFYINYNNKTYQLGYIEGILSHFMSCEMPDLQNAIEEIAPGFEFKDLEFSMSFANNDRTYYVDVDKNPEYEWSHGNESRIFLGEVAAQPTIVPLMDKHWLLG